MNMRKKIYALTTEDLKRFKYPNLIAEVKETPYSICTIAEHMGLSRPYRKEDDPETWGKLLGDTEISVSESVGLARLFGVNLEYLFSHELKLVLGKSAAYWRWFDENRKIEEDIERNKQIREIEQELREKPYLLKFMKVAVTLNNDQIDELVNQLRPKKRNH